MPRWLVIQHDDDVPPGLLAEWAVTRDIELHVVRAAMLLPAPEDFAAVVSLGSDASVYDERVPWRAAELEQLRAALAADVPVLGICYGAQALAWALGAEVRRAPQPEVRWSQVDTRDAALIPAGPWLQWHVDAFDVPQGARLLAQTDVCPQAFATGRSVGVQFHPEADAAIVAGWTRAYPESLAAAGTSAAELAATTEANAPAARTAAFAFFDAFAARAG